MRNSSFHLSASILAAFLAVCPQPAASQFGAGGVQISLHDPSGQPAAGVIVSLDGTCQQVVTDENGLASFKLVAEGEQSWSVARELLVPDEHGLPVHQRFTLDAAIQATVLAGQVNPVQATVEIKAAVVFQQPPICVATPWCGVVGGWVAGMPRVVIGGGVHGNCACTFAGGPAIPAACPGRRTVAPAPLGVHTITTTTCLGGPLCAPPNKAVTCSIVL